MQVKDILALPIARLAAEDAVLWLWVTNAHLRTAFRCLDQWGFRERGLLTWDKVHMGLGDLLRGQTEHVVIATRGSPRFNREAAKRTTTLLREPKTRAHSRKPAGFYALVERLCFGKRAELFAREKREGWTALLSPEVDKFLGRTGPS
jgi:N6-adenosine-specific RNA methylase IME4